MLENNLTFADEADEYEHPIAQQFYSSVNTMFMHHHLQ